MKKKYIQLTNEHIDHFRHLDFYDSMDLLQWPDAFAIGATVDIDDSGTDMPAALVVVKAEEDQFCIYWLYVSEDYRGLGIGGNLLKLLVEESKARGLKTISVRISSIYEHNGLPWNPRNFFEECYFEKEEKNLPEWEFSTSLLYGKKDVYIHTKKKSNIIPLSDVPDSFKAQLYSRISELGHLPYDINVLQEKADPDLSYVLVEDKKPMGVVLVNKSGDNIYPYYFEAEDKMAADFVADAFEMSEDCVAVGDRVRIVPNRTAILSIFKQLEFSIPGWDVVNLVAKVEDF